MKKVSINLIVGIIFAFIGTLFVIIGVITKSSFNKPIDNMVETTGVISDIYEYDDDTKVYVTFTDINGNINKVESQFYSSSMRIGDEIKVYYNSLNPKNYRVDDLGVTKILFYVFTGMGSFLALIGFILILTHIKSKKHIKEVMNSGIVVSGKIISVDRNSLYNVNGRFPYRIVVSFEYNSLVYEVLSENIWNDPKYIIDTYGITELPVYVDTSNPKKSVLDCKQITDKLG